MAEATLQPMYEAGLLRQAAGETLHPGGLDLTERMLALCCLPVEAHILDAGCGSGATVEYLRQAGFVHALGFDRSGSLLRTYANPGAGLPLACAKGETLPIAASQLDAVFAECSLLAMGDLESILAEIKRVLRPGGQLAISDVYARNPAGLPALHALPLSCGLSDILTQDEFVECLQAHGFEILTWEDHSETLKALTCQITLSHGSMSEFWSQSEPAADSLDLQIALSKAKLGYFLLVARKVEYG